MSAYKEKIKGLAADGAEFSACYASARQQREQTKQARILAEIEILSKLNLSHEMLIEDCAARKVEHEIYAETCADYMRANGITLNALDVAAPMADKLSDSQSDKAKLPRGIIAEIKADLVRKYPNHKAKELWPHLFAELDGRGLDPIEIDDTPGGEVYEYDCADGRKPIGFRSFANIKIGK